jgi:glutamine synthetase
MEPLVAVVTTDLAAITRGRSVVQSRLEKITTTGVGWLQANLSLTPFNSIVSPNPWGSSGDLRLVPDLNARFRTAGTGSATPFDMVAGDLIATAAGAEEWATRLAAALPTADMPTAA